MWRIKNWDGHFENARSRDVEAARWVPIPNKQDGDGYLTLVDPPDGMACYGAFMAIVLLASKCKPRGDLVQSNGLPHTVETIARKTHVRAPLIQTALQRCADPKVDWIEWVADDAAEAGVAVDLFASGDGSVGVRPPSGTAVGCLPKGRPAETPSAGNGNGNGSGNSPPPPARGVEMSFRCQGTPEKHELAAADLLALERQWPGVRVTDCLLDLERRLAAPPPMRKTAAQMPAFLQTWLRMEVERVKRFLVVPELPAAAKGRRLASGQGHSGRAADVAARIRAGEV